MSNPHQCLGPNCLRPATTKEVFCGRCWHLLPSTNRTRLETHHAAGHRLYNGYPMTTYLQELRSAIRALTKLQTDDPTPIAPAREHQA